MLSGQLHAFRSVTAQQIGKELIQESEENFQLSSHVELYNYTTVNKKGEIETGRMFIIFRYFEDKVQGVFRILATAESPGVTLVSNQPIGEIPELFLHDPKRRMSGLVPLSDRKQKLGNTDWYLESIYDDDKNPWRYQSLDPVVIRGEACKVVEGHYQDESLAEHSFMNCRKVYLSEKDSRAMLIESYDSLRNLIFSLEVPQHQMLNIDGEKQLRANRIHLTDHREGSTTLMHQVQAAWNPNLPNKFFKLSDAPQWDLTWDQFILNEVLSEQ